MTHSYTLTYFDIRGRAEVVRIMFAIAGQSYTDERLQGEAWQQRKPDTPFGQLPTLTVDNKVVLCQSDAIYAYVAKQFGFAGETDIEAAQIAMISGCIEDTTAPLMKLFSAETEEQKAAIVKKYESEQLPQYLRSLEKLLVSNEGGDRFFVGSKLSYADIKLQIIFDIADRNEIKYDMALYPKLAALRKRVEAIPAIKEWVARRPVTNM